MIKIIVISKKANIRVLMWEILIETHYRMNRLIKDNEKVQW